LITILIWNTLAAVYVGSLATQIAIDLSKQTFISEEKLIWIITWIVTFIMLVFWEIIPKSLAMKNSSFIALLVAPIYKF
jgi:Mg2+/Co2+ transporter CorB